VDAWERQAGEPNLWYGRFEVFRLLGPGRSIEAVFQAEGPAKVGKGQQKRRPSRHWYRASQRWRWPERAEAWDGAERDLIRAAEAAGRVERHRLRLERAGAAQAFAASGLTVAELGTLSKEEARSMLGVLRLMLLEGMKAERLEDGESTENVVAVAAKVTAEDVIRGEVDLDGWWAERRAKRARGTD